MIVHYVYGMLIKHDVMLEEYLDFLKFFCWLCALLCPI